MPEKQQMSPAFTSQLLGLEKTGARTTSVGSLSLFLNCQSFVTSLEPTKMLLNRLKTA